MANIREVDTRDSEDRREQRISAARRRVRSAVDREQTRAVFRAAGARDVDDAAIEAAAVLTEERLIELAARAVEAQEERDESRLSASSVALAARREAEDRRRRIR